jgi:glycosyltransferase involved in cell wall biosynthesis
MKRKRISVTAVIPFYNDRFVGEAVDSALSQTHAPLEIIVVDDGSTREKERLARYNGRIEVIRKPNGGTASALNAGFRRASGDYVAWLSSDDRWRPDKIERQAAFMESTGAWISHTAFRVVDEHGRPEGKDVRLHFRTMPEFYRSFLSGNVVNGCTVMMRKALFDKLGGFDENLPYTHDYDFWLRSILAGYPLAYLDEALTEYRRHPAMGTVRNRGDVELEFQAVSAHHRKRIERLLEALQPIARVSQYRGPIE